MSLQYKRHICNGMFSFLKAVGLESCNGRQCLWGLMFIRHILYGKRRCLSVCLSVVVV